MAESQNIEWKESWRDEYLKWICGFANAQGGKIYIGTNDDGTVIGIKDSKKLMEDIPNKVRDVLGIIVDVNLLAEEEKDYIEICVNPNTYPVNYRGEYHYRSGSTKQLMKGQALNQFLLKKTGITWDSVPVQGAAIKDLRNDSFDIFREQAVKSKRMDEPDIQVTNEQLLDHLNLINEGLLTRAAILLFHHNPEKWIPGSYVKIAYFQSESDILYQDEVHGSLLLQADSVVDLIYTKYLKGIISYQNITRVETYPYPKEAIREAVLIKDSCILAGNDIPEYKVKREDIMVLFRSSYNKNTQDSTQDDTQDSTQEKALTDKEKQILSICKEEKSKQEIATLMGYRTIKSIKPEVDSLLNKGKLKMSIPDKPKSKNQKYIAAREKNIH